MKCSYENGQYRKRKPTNKISIQIRLREDNKKIEVFTIRKLNRDSYSFWNVQWIEIANDSGPSIHIVRMAYVVNEQNWSIN